MITRIGLLLVLASMAAAPVRSAELPVVMVVHSYDPDLYWVRQIRRGIDRTLADTARLEHVYMDTKRVSDKLYGKAASRALQRFEEISPSAVIISDDNALGLVGEPLAAKVPVVFCGINGSIRKEFPWMVSNSNVTGIMERPLIRRTIIESANAVGMNLKSVLILLGHTPTANAFYHTDLDSMPVFEIREGLSATVLRSGRVADWQQWIKTSKANGYDLILVAAFHRLIDEDQIWTAEQTSRWISEQAPVPVITVHSQFISRQLLLGGMVVDGEKMGADAALMMQRILTENVVPRDIPILFKNRTTLMFSRAQLKKWGLQVTQEYLSRVRLLY